MWSFLIDIILGIRMEHLKQLLKKTEFIEKYGIGNAHLLWALGLYLDESDFDKLASDGLTDGGNDKKIDFITVINSTLFIAQGYYCTQDKLKLLRQQIKLPISTLL